MKLEICHLYPDVLNLYGDRGNILCLRKRLEWRGIDCIIDEKNIGDPVDFAAYDFCSKLIYKLFLQKSLYWARSVGNVIPF